MIKKINQKLINVNQNNIIGTSKNYNQRQTLLKPKNDIEKNYWFTLNREDIFKYTGKKFSKYIIYLNGNYKFTKT